MKNYLNLLPEEKRENIIRKKVFWLMLGQCVRLVLVVLIFVGILFSFNMVLEIKLSALENVRSLEQTQGGFQGIYEYENKFKEINNKTNELSKIQNQHLYWSEILRELSRIIFSEISITSLTNDGFQISLEGKARTRDDLIDFQNRINNSYCFSGAEAPVSSLALKENVDFSMEFKLEENCLKR